MRNRPGLVAALAGLGIFASAASAPVAGASSGLFAASFLVAASGLAFCCRCGTHIIRHVALCVPVYVVLGLILDTHPRIDAAVV